MAEFEEKNKPFHFVKYFGIAIINYMREIYIYVCCSIFKRKHKITERLKPIVKFINKGARIKLQNVRLKTDVYEIFYLRKYILYLL